MTIESSPPKLSIVSDCFEDIDPGIDPENSFGGVIECETLDSVGNRCAVSDYVLLDHSVHVSPPNTTVLLTIVLSHQDSVEKETVKEKGW